jgi:hypothetical protein
MRTPQPLRVAIVLDHNGTLQAAGIIRGDVAEGARLLGAIRDPLKTFLAEARLRAIQAQAVASSETGDDEAAVAAHRGERS